MDIRNTTIYEVPENETTKEYIDKQKYTFKRENGGSVLVITDKQPDCECRELEDAEELSQGELYWSGLIIATITISSDDPEIRAGVNAIISELGDKAGTMIEEAVIESQEPGAAG